MLIFLKPAF